MNNNFNVYPKFDKIERYDINSKNKLFIGHIGKSKFFVKEYIVRKGREKEDILKAKHEILCYKKIRVIKLPKVVLANFNKRTLILEFVELKDIEASKSNVDKILRLYLGKVIKIDASFLPKTDYGYYTRDLYKHAKILGRLGIIKNFDEKYRLITDNMALIRKSKKCFSHGDLHLGNVKYYGKELTMIDLEHAKRDNPMHDLASLYIDIYHDKKLAKYFLNKLRKTKIFNDKLFSIMILVRSIEILFALKDEPELKTFQITKRLVNECDFIDS